MIPSFSKIEIKEPPIEQLTKKRSCFRRACITGFGCIGIVVVISLIFLKFTLRPHAVELKDVPSSFVEAVPLYDIEGIEHIAITAGAERNRGAEYAAFLPKLFIAPMVLVLDRESTFSIAAPDEIKKGIWSRFIAFMKAPVADHRDVLTLEWIDLDADAEFLENHYRRELKKREFIIGATGGASGARQFSFNKAGIDGMLYIKDNPERTGIDTLTLTVTLNIN